MPDEQRAMYFLVCGLHLTNKEIKIRITQYFNSRQVDRAMYRIISRGNLPEWFSRLFFYDPLYCILDPLRNLMCLGLTFGMVRIDGTYCDYHLDLSEPTIRTLLRDEKLDFDEVKKFADQLSEEILTPGRLPTM